MPTGRDLVKQALRELLVLNPTQDVNDDDAEFGLEVLNRLLDRWNASSWASFATPFAPFTLTPAIHPHTIGPSTATFAADVRPVAIDAANLIINTVRMPIQIRTKDWYQALSTPEITTTVPTDLYYEPAVPNGKLWLYPVPSAAYQIELWTRSAFAALTLAGSLTAPPGYHDALVKTLAEELQGPFRVSMPDRLPQLAREARALIFDNNVVMPTLNLRDAVIGVGPGSFNYITGETQ